MRLLCYIISMIAISDKITTLAYAQSIADYKNNIQLIIKVTQSNSISEELYVIVSSGKTVTTHLTLSSRNLDLQVGNFGEQKVYLQGMTRKANKLISSSSIAVPWRQEGKFSSSSNKKQDNFLVSVTPWRLQDSRPNNFAQPTACQILTDNPLLTSTVAQILTTCTGKTVSLKNDSTQKQINFSSAPMAPTQFLDFVLQKLK